MMKVLKYGVILFIALGVIGAMAPHKKRSSESSFTVDCRMDTWNGSTKLNCK